MKRSWIAAAVLAAIACSGGNEETPEETLDPAILRAQCSTVVVELCSEFQRAEQLECVRRELEECIREGSTGAPTEE